MMDIIQFPRPTLFLEFFVREFSFYGKGIVRTTLPEDAFFYTGPSKATEYRFFELVDSRPMRGVRQYKSSNYLSFINQVPRLSIAAKQNSLVESLFTPNTNAILSLSGEYFFENQWMRSENRIKSNKYVGEQSELMYHNIRSLAPYQFHISSVTNDGTIWTQFPRSDVELSILPGQTACFLCRREQYEFNGMDISQPNLNLVLWVKNHGLHHQISYISEPEAEQYDSSSLCVGEFTLKDFRKSRLKYQLG
ncbi:hypothetical protein I2492_15705 [Budviciaceae bacterium CWB-B4]|uniref:Uncharacterized protein n=1 Tax=Limnobaculum xujianqingii TaxID=2738837 RepID=A0A9D7FVN4_9GAMM|nr:hypothetical protein [Limnobaculum xujianqingii]MBK5074567.1 hypothetical protein [Limnobaculum xujianqingii]MBK5177767.1 hypothetical protein [Limnobaculum xujianqingii]